MKRASELGLEVLNFEGKTILLIDRKAKLRDNVGFYIDDEDLLRPCSNPLFIEQPEHHGLVIASEKQLPETALLVIEDEVEKLAEVFYKDYQSRPYAMEKGAWRQGYKTHQKTHPYSEEDLRNAIQKAKSHTKDEDGCWFHNTEDQIIQSLKKKELWIEVEEIRTGTYEPCKKIIEPKIENGQLKAMWK